MPKGRYGEGGSTSSACTGMCKPGHMAVLAAQAMLVPACVLQAVTVQVAARQKSVMASVPQDVIAQPVLKRAVHVLRSVSS